MTDIYFVRHGQSVANANKACAGCMDVELTELGRTQALEAGAELARSGVVIDKIVTSPLRRARETAECIADAIGVKHEDIVVTEFARERNFGEYEGKLIAARRGVTKEVLAKMGVESVDAMAERARQLHDFVEGLAVQSVLVVSHNQFGCVFVATERGKPIEIVVNKLPNAHIFKI